MIVARIAYTDTSRRFEREQHLEAHKAHLRGADIRILQSGPFTGADMFGALVVADVERREDFERFSNEDPFVRNRVYHSVHIVDWSITLAAPPLGG